jgi:2-amino-4-hydroxy-6-hydroxymethyldihydropteridine diphosphokinase
VTTRPAFLGLGSNLGDRRAALERAVTLLAVRGDVVAVSPVYETEPMGGPEDQDPYLNVVVELSTADSPRALLERCRGLEEDAGRVRTVRFGPRTLDADVLMVGQERVDEPDLVVPHPRMLERRFVLVPLADLAPDLVPAAALQSAVGTVVRVGTLRAFTTSVTKSDR